MRNIFKNGESNKTRKCIVIRHDNTPYDGKLYLMNARTPEGIPTLEELNKGEFTLQGYHLTPGQNPCFRLTKDSPKNEAYDLPLQLDELIELKSNEYVNSLLWAHVKFIKKYAGHDTVWD